MTERATAVRFRRVPARAQQHEHQRSLRIAQPSIEVAVDQKRRRFEQLGLNRFGILTPQSEPR